MEKIYSIWTEYALFVVSVLIAYCDRTNHWPLPFSLGFLLLPMMAAKLFLPHWASLSIYAAVGFPLAWFFGVMFWAFLRGHRQTLRAQK